MQVIIRVVVQDHEYKLKLHSPSPTYYIKQYIKNVYTMYKGIVSCKGPEDVIQERYNSLVQEIYIKVKYVCRISTAVYPERCVQK